MKHRITKRRNNYEIMIEILRLAKEPIRITKIVFRANLNFQLAHKYLDNLRAKGLIEPNFQKCWITTHKGRIFIERMRDAQIIVKTP